jgi:hypothetical protein
LGKVSKLFISMQYRKDQFVNIMTLFYHIIRLNPPSGTLKYTILFVFIFIMCQPVFCSDALGQRAERVGIASVNQTDSAVLDLNDQPQGSLADRALIRFGQVYGDDVDAWLKLFLQIIGGGLLAGLAIFVSNVALDHYRKPELIVLKNIDATVPIDLPIFEWDHPYYRGLHKFTIRYKVQRIAVWNNSGYAAEDCKAALRQGESEEKVC